MMRNKKIIIIVVAVIVIVSLFTLLIFSQNKNDTIKNEGEASLKFNKDSQEATKAYPIITDLPQDISPIFRIDYGVSKRYPNDPTKIALYISYDNVADKISALDYIYRMGYDPSDYEIIFESL